MWEAHRWLHAQCCMEQTPFALLTDLGCAWFKAIDIGPLPWHLNFYYWSLASSVYLAFKTDTSSLFNAHMTITVNSSFSLVSLQNLVRITVSPANQILESYWWRRKNHWRQKGCQTWTQTWMGEGVSRTHSQVWGCRQLFRYLNWVPNKWKRREETEQETRGKKGRWNWWAPSSMVFHCCCSRSQLYCKVSKKSSNSLTFFSWMASFSGSESCEGKEKFWAYSTAWSD